MTPDEVEAIRERVEAATPLPWTAGDDGLVWSDRAGDPVSGSTELSDAEFIAHARADVPALLAALAEAQRERDEARRLAETCTCYDGNPQNYEGPHADCAVHGAIRAYNEASADLAAALEQRDDARAQLAAVEAERDRFVRAGQDAIKDLDAAQRREELMRPVVEAAKAWRGRYLFALGRPGEGHGVTAQSRELVTAVDTYETQTGGTDG